MDRLQTMSVFVAVAEEESFSAAARRLNLSPPVVTRAVAELEKRLSVKLLNRTTRYVRATEAGLRYVEDARRILDEVDIADEAAAGVNAAPKGRLVVTAPALFGQMHVTPGIVDFLSRYPETQVRAMFFDRIVNMLEEGIDVGVRIGELPDSSMRALKVGEVGQVCVASPTYLKKHGEPDSPKDLTDHSTIISSTANHFIDWQFVSAKRTQSFKISPRLVVSTNSSAIEAARKGFGITRVLSYQVAPLVDSGELRVILQNHDETKYPVHIIHREGRYSSPKIRSFIDLLAKRLRSNPVLN